MPIRIVFMGSPQFSVPSLITLSSDYPIVGVVTQPDRPAGRGRQLTASPVKIAAEELGLPILQPTKLRSPEAMEQIREWMPDLIVVAAFGQILRPDILDLPKYGCLNVHASLLPRWRGAAPIQAAILNNDPKTGITIMKMDAGVDTGSILTQEGVQIFPTDTGGSLSERLAESGAALLKETLPGYLDGMIKPQIQDGSQATYAPMIQKSDGALDFNQPAELLVRKVRAYQPWPGAFMFWNGQILKILHASASSGAAPELAGKQLIYRGLPTVATSAELLILEEIQPAGKRAMSGADFLRGVRDWVS